MSDKLLQGLAEHIQALDSQLNRVGGTTENFGCDWGYPLPHSRHNGLVLQVKCGVNLKNHRMRATEGIKCSSFRVLQMVWKRGGPDARGPTSLLPWIVLMLRYIL